MHGSDGAGRTALHECCSYREHSLPADTIGNGM